MLECTDSYFPPTCMQKIPEKYFTEITHGNKESKVERRIVYMDPENNLGQMGES